MAQEWDELAERLAAPPFLRSDWFLAWWRAFGTGTLELLTLYEDRRVTAAAAFYRRRGRLQSLANYHTPEFGVLAEDETAASTIIREIFARSPRSIAVWFTDLDMRIHALVRTAAEEHWYRVIDLPAVRSPYVDTHGDWNTYERGLGANTRGDLRRQWRRLREQGAVEVDVEEGNDRLDELLEEGYGIEGSGWKERRHTSIASNLQTHQFYTELAQRARRHGWLRLCFLRLDGRAIAFQFDLAAYGIQYHLKGGYDLAFRRYSPGKVLHYALIKRAFAHGTRRYEFLGGPERYKMEFARDIRTLRRIEAFAPSVSGQLEWAFVRYGRPFVRRVQLGRRGR